MGRHIPMLCSVLTKVTPVPGALRFGNARSWSWTWELGKRTWERLWTTSRGRRSRTTFSDFNHRGMSVMLGGHVGCGPVPDILPVAPHA
eukprot:650561-Rhodomonas_salina.11